MAGSYASASPLAAHATELKVFWFFSSEKNIASCLPDKLLLDFAT
jgi:hypothetical protein